MVKCTIPKEILEQIYPMQKEGYPKEHIPSDLDISGLDARLTILLNMPCFCEDHNLVKKKMVKGYVKHIDYNLQGCARCNALTSIKQSCEDALRKRDNKIKGEEDGDDTS